MWNYEKRLQFPVNIKNPDARAAKVIMSQYGGPYPNFLSRILSLSPKHAFKPFPVLSAFHNLFENRPCHLVFFCVAYVRIL